MQVQAALINIGVMLSWFDEHHDLVERIEAVVPVGQWVGLLARPAHTTTTSLSRRTPL